MMDQQSSQIQRQTTYPATVSPTRASSNVGQIQSMIVLRPTRLPMNIAAIWQNQVNMLRPALIPVCVVASVMPTESKTTE